MSRRECLLLTGSTGLIGRATVRYLQKLQPERSIFALVRKPAQQKQLHELRVHGILGDLTQPNLGITPFNYSNLRQNLTEILHVAAEVVCSTMQGRHSYPPGGAVRVPTLEVRPIPKTINYCLDHQWGMRAS